MEIEDAIRQAIIDKFFEPIVVPSMGPVQRPDGSVSMQSILSLTEAPVMQVARDIWRANSAAITKAVMDRLDVEDIVKQVTTEVTTAVIKQLTEVPGNRWSSNPTTSERQRMMTKVYDQVAEEFGRQCVEHLRQTGGLMGILESSNNTNSL